ncbi:MAG TPA: hypothetical protein VK509_21475, partial [Polyangiales bacterium]|nr:hypothetical protein [Polyangiales bacterium]
MSPVMAEVGTVEIPLLARIAKLAEVPSRTGTPALTMAPVVKLQLCSSSSAMPDALSTPVVIVAVSSVLLASIAAGQNTAVSS